MAPILPFRQAADVEIPTPVYYQPGDEYDLIRLHDDSLLRAGFVAGCAFYVKLGHIFPGVPHLSMWHDRPRLGYITDLGPHGIDWISFDPLMPNGRYTTREAQIAGAVTEIWSFGLGHGKPRWVFDELASVWRADDGYPPLLQLAN